MKIIKLAGIAIIVALASTGVQAKPAKASVTAHILQVGPPPPPRPPRPRAPFYHRNHRWHHRRLHVHLPPPPPLPPHP